jgi:hypothetical protein
MAMIDTADVSRTEGWGHAEPSGKDRREGERAMAYWEHKLRELGGEVTVAGLDLNRINSRDWSNRFLIAVDPVFARSSLVLYGPQFARLLHLPPQARADLPILRQLPQRYADVFQRGCAAVQREMAPVRIEGEVERYDGRIEQYRVVFIPVGVKPHSLTYFAFGGFSHRVIEAHAAA